MFAEGSYASLSGTNVYRDFVELPSQLMENWLTEKEFLDQIAIHYKTREKIPQELVQKLIDASNFNAGYACCRQLSFGFLDMAWHTRTEPFGEDVISFEKEAWKQTVIVPEVPGTLMSSSFGHIFSGGYSAGYYGYKWARSWMPMLSQSSKRRESSTGKQPVLSVKTSYRKAEPKIRISCTNVSGEKMRKSVPC